MSAREPHGDNESAAHAQFFPAHGLASVGAGHRSAQHAHAGRSHGGFGSFGRARHGSVRAMLLWALAEKPMHGYQIMQELEERSSGFWRLSPGSLYPTLQQLEDEGLVTAGAGKDRRVYTLTDAGRAEAQAIRAGHGEAPWLVTKGVGERRFRLWRALSELADVTREVALSGSEEHHKQTLRVLEEASAQIDAALAKDVSGAV